MIESFMAPKASERRTLADMIMEKIEEKEAAAARAAAGEDDDDEDAEPALPPKVCACALALSHTGC